MTFGTDVGEQVRDVTESGLLGADAAGEQRFVHVVLAGIPGWRTCSNQGRKHLK